MHPIRKRRLKLVIFLVAVSSIAVGLLVFALRENINLFYTPVKIAAGEAPVGRQIRAGGMVVKGSLERAADRLFSTFRITDGAAELEVHYSGILPDLFAEGEAAVVSGSVDGDGVFQANQVLAKHDENYTPPEVAQAMEEGHARAAAGEHSDSSAASESSRAGAYETP
ncbi:MAG: cytochrome c maturation protein CcmE [bacterium]